MNKLKADVKNWRTTTVGVLTGAILCLTQLVNLLDNDPETVFTLSLFLTGLGALGIGVFAKDGDKTSEDVGLK